jgi:hypothetical protein
MRKSAVKDCLRILAHYKVDPGKGEAIDIGGTERVFLDDKIEKNPLLELNSKLKCLDMGFNINALGTRADVVGDFLDPKCIKELFEKFQTAFCFDTLEHVPDPFGFCRNLIYIVKPGGHIFLTTVFEWPYHPSPEDFFRFSPRGLEECFSQMKNELSILWCGWGSDRRGVALLACKGPQTAKAEGPLALTPEDLPRDYNPMGILGGIWRRLQKYMKRNFCLP